MHLKLQKRQEYLAREEAPRKTKVHRPGVAMDRPFWDNGVWEAVAKAEACGVGAEQPCQGA